MNDKEKEAHEALEKAVRLHGKQLAAIAKATGANDVEDAAPDALARTVAPAESRPLEQRTFEGILSLTASFTSAK